MLGAEPGGGVFAVGHCDHPYQRSMLAYYEMGDGPFYLFYRPHHLCHVETMTSIARAALDGRAFLQPRHGMRTNVFAFAKRDLAAGERLDGVGGYACYGQIDNLPGEGDHPGLPVCLAQGQVLVRPVARDAPVLLSDVRLEAGRPELELYRLSLAPGARESA